MAGKASAAENFSYGDRSERIRWSRDDREIPETLRKENAACFESFSMHPLRGSCPSFPGENTEKPCQRRASPVNASLRCGKFTDALRQGSSAGQSMRFIPAASGVQIPPLLPEAIKKSKVDDLGLFYFIGFSAVERLTGAKQKTTRYAGGNNTLYTQKHLSATMKLFKPIATLTERCFCYGNQGS